MADSSSRFRWTTRRLLGAVGVIGFVIGASIEWRNRRARDFWVRAESSYLEVARKSRLEREICDRNAGDVPYSLQDRENAHAFLSPGIVWYSVSFASGAEESAFHSETLNLCLVGAAEASQKRAFYQGRLLIP